jgi:hypothetical protein
MGRTAHADLAVGVLGETVGLVSAAGAVNVIYGTDGGLTAARDQFWHQDVSSVLDVAEDGDLFGGSLSAGDFGRSGLADLAVGVDSEDVGAVVAAGAVNVLFAGASGLSASDDQFWHQDSPGTSDVPEMSDIFGRALVR